jgi:hypothetical protein
MKYAEQQKASFKEQFAVRRKRQIIPFVASILAVIAVKVATDELNGRAVIGIPGSVIGPLSLMFVVGVIAFSSRNWRCPACNNYLGREIGPRFCSKCGVALQ